MRRFQGGALVGVLVIGCSMFDAPRTIADEISIEPRFGASLATGETLRLRAFALVGNRIVPAISARWTTTDSLTVAIDGSGLIVAVRPGSATIRATVDTNTTEVRIHVFDPDAELPRRLRLSPAGPLRMVVGQSASLTPVDSLGPIPWFGDTVFWTSDDPEVASVSQAGAVTAHREGTTTITAESGDSVTTAVVHVLPATATAIEPPFVTLTVGSAMPLIAPHVGAWTSAQTTIATVSDSGEVTARSAGTTEVTATLADGSDSAWSTVSVINASVVRIRLSLGTETISLGTSIQATAFAIDASNAVTHPRVTWRSSAPKTAVVTEDGVVTGLAEGEAEITVLAGGQQAMDTVRVISGSSGASLNSLAASGMHTCGVAVTAAFCWGDNSNGQLGDGTLTNRTLPTPVGGTAPLESIVAGLTAGFDHTCGLSAARDAYCWGENSSGQLGDSTIIARSGPTLVSGGHKFRFLAAGFLFTCGVTLEGDAYCWGANGSGQLGVDSQSQEPTPSPRRVVGSLAFVGMSAGAFHVCGWTAEGAAYCWGGNGGGQLGDGRPLTGNNRPDVRPTPQRVVGAVDAWSQLTAGTEHTCGIARTGRAYCWGRNFAFQLGTGDAAAASEPASVDAAFTFKQLVAGGFHSCGLTDDGRAFCWGDNARGQLGDPNGVERASPTPVSGRLRFAELVAGFQHTCGRTTAGETYCWGDNSLGQLGDGSKRTRFVPTPTAVVK